MTIPVLKYRNPNFNEEAMVRKIRKNALVGIGYRRLYGELAKEVKNCLERFDDAFHARRYIEVADQMTFMRDHAQQYGVSLEGLL